MALNKIEFVSTLLVICLLISCSDKLDPKVENAISAIREENRIILDFVFKNPKYVELMEVATNEDLVYLTDDENPNVRYFAFIGLLERNHPKVNDVYNKHKKDEEKIETSNGACLINSIPINVLMEEAMSTESVYSVVFSKNKYHTGS